MRVLVTGGAGFIGSHLVDRLLSQGHSVAVVDDMSTGSEENLNPAARLYRASIADETALAEVFERERPAVVNHHAAQTDVRRSMAHPAADAEVNVVGTVRVLEMCLRWRVERLVFASTCAVYSEPRYLPIDEAHPIGPQSGYGLSKHTAERYIGLLAGTGGLSYCILRYGNVFGPRQNPKGEAGVVAIFAGQLLSGEQPTIFGDGRKTRDYVYVDDIVEGNALAMASGEVGTYNLAWGRGVRDIEVFEAVREAVGAQVAPNYAPKRPGEADHVSLDPGLALRALGWRPAVGFEDGVKRCVAQLRR